MNNITYRSVRHKLAILAIILLGVACNSSQTFEVYAPDNKAINGYDPVAFFTEAKPVKGNNAFAYKWKDATWYFASQKNLDAFKTQPEKYAPQYGGFCAYGTAEGHKAPTKPETWTVENNKLYFNYDMGVKKEWDKDRTGLIKKGDEAWPEVKKQN